MKITVKIDPTECISAANCVGVAPQFFQLGSEPYVELLDGAQVVGTEHSYEVTKEQLELLEEAAESCPTRAIQILGKS
jgi:ferredoxin